MTARWQTGSCSWGASSDGLELEAIIVTQHQVQGSSFERVGQLSISEMLCVPAVGVAVVYSHKSLPGSLYSTHGVQCASLGSLGGGPWHSGWSERPAYEVPLNQVVVPVCSK